MSLCRSRTEWLSERKTAHLPLSGVHQPRRICGARERGGKDLWRIPGEVKCILMGLIHAVLQKNVISGAEPLASAGWRQGTQFHLSSQTIQSNYACCGRALEKTQWGFYTHFDTRNTLRFKCEKDCTSLLTREPNYANQHVASVKYKHYCILRYALTANFVGSV